MSASATQGGHNYWGLQLCNLQHRRIWLAFSATAEFLVHLTMTTNKNQIKSDFHKG